MKKKLKWLEGSKIGKKKNLRDLNLPMVIENNLTKFLQNLL